MCYAIIEAKFAAGEDPQTLRPETEDECNEKLNALRANDHCTKIKIFKMISSVARESAWVSKL